VSALTRKRGILDRSRLTGLRELLPLEPLQAGDEVFTPGGIQRLREKLVDDGQVVVEGSDGCELRPVDVAYEAAQGGQVERGT
jgi:hypothetical protein